MSGRWTEQQLSRLRALEALGLSASQIATDLGISKNAVIGKQWNLRRQARATKAVMAAEGVGLGALYICLEDGCDWSGDLPSDGACPCCRSALTAVRFGCGE